MPHDVLDNVPLRASSGDGGTVYGHKGTVETSGRGVTIWVLYLRTMSGEVIHHHVPRLGLLNQVFLKGGEDALTGSLCIHQGEDVLWVEAKAVDQQLSLQIDICEASPQGTIFSRFRIIINPYQQSEFTGCALSKHTGVAIA